MNRNARISISLTLEVNQFTISIVMTPEKERQWMVEAVGKLSSPFEPTPWDRDHNPSLVEWWRNHTHGSFSDPWYVGSVVDEFKSRDKCIEKYGFAVPTKKALEAIIKTSPKGILEIGAGTGYWSNLLKLLGAEVRACDDGSGFYAFKVGSCFSVEKIDYKKLLKKEPELHHRTLLMVWPSYGNVEAFSAFKGDTVVYVGELGDGCTGYDSEIEKAWELKKHVELPVWSGIHDSMAIFTRKA